AGLGYKIKWIRLAGANVDAAALLRSFLASSRSIAAGTLTTPLTRNELPDGLYAAQVHIVRIADNLTLTSSPVVRFSIEVGGGDGLGIAGRIALVEPADNSSLLRAGTIFRWRRIPNEGVNRYRLRIARRGANESPEQALHGPNVVY